MTFLDKFGIDSRQLRTLFVVYFKQDFRGGKSVFQQGKKDYVTSNTAVLSLLGLYLTTGLFIGVAAFISNVLIFSIITISYTFFIVALTIIAESGNVIFNENEPDIIGHLPVTSRTLFAAKVLNLFSFTALLAAAINLFPSVMGIWAKGSNALFPAAHLVAALGVAMFSTALVVTGYGLLMRYVNKERFNNIIAYAQGALTIFFILGYQLLPRLVEDGGAALNEADPTYFLFYPPAWFSGVAMLIVGRVNWLSLALAALAALSLVLLVTLALRKVSAGYTSFVSALAHDAGGVKPKAERRRKRATPSLSFVSRVKAAALREPVERAVFDLVSTYLRRDREVKVRLYPTFAYLLMFPVIGLFSGGLPDPFGDPDSKTIFQTLAGAAMIPFIAMSAVETVVFSEHYAAAYIFRVAPVGSRGGIHSGLRKAILAYVAIPGVVILLAMYGVIWKNLAHAALVLLPWLLLTPAMMLIPFIRRERLPLARKYQKGQQSARSMFLFMGVFLFFFLAGGVQSFSLSGGFSYYLFLAGITFFALLLHFVLHKASGESTPLGPPEEGDGE